MYNNKLIYMILNIIINPSFVKYYIVQVEIKTFFLFIVLNLAFNMIKYLRKIINVTIIN